MRRIKVMWAWVALLAGWPLLGKAVVYELSLGEGQGEPGQIAVVPLFLNNAADVASLEFQINFDPSLLAVAGVTNPPGSLGEAFDIAGEVDDGVLIVRMFRMEGMISGSGLLCRVQFRVNPGAEPGLWCDTALADAGLAGQYGDDLAWRNDVERKNGKVWAVFSSTNDADADGLSDYEEQMMNGSPDYDPGGGDTAVGNPDTDGDGMRDGWEAQYGLNPLSNDANADRDGDGLDNGQEAASGLDPTKTDTDGDGCDDRAEHIAGTGGTDADDYFVLTMEAQAAAPDGPILRWRSETGRIYSVEHSADLLELWPAVPDYVVHGDGAEQFFTNESAAEAMGYFRLKVEME